MARLTLSMFDPIEIEILGVGLFKIETLSSRVLGDFQAAVKAFGEKPEEVTPEEIGKALMKMIPGITLDQAMQIDFRHIVKIAGFIADQITDAAKPSTEKN